MLNGLMDLARPMLFALEGEQAHEITLRSLERGLYPRLSNNQHPQLATRLWGLNFPNPLGIAAGFDKNARVADAILGMGLGFAEIGTITPRPQAGNPKPRVFRLINERGMINRLGFNNEGHQAAYQRLLERSRKNPNNDGIIGVNIGANKDTTDRVEDYITGLRKFNKLASYFTINISSPNTPGLRDLQAPSALEQLLGRLMAAREDLIAAGEPQRPIIVKLAPDINEEDLAAIVQRLVRHEVDGIAISNTTLTRPGLANNTRASEPGGLSGRPLFHRSTVMLARVYRLSNGRIPLIGIGGIDSAETALAKIQAGASLLQLYTGLVYGGGRLIDSMQKYLADFAAREGLDTISKATGSAAEVWSNKPLDQ